MIDAPSWEFGISWRGTSRSAKLYVYLVLSSPIISDVGEHAIMVLQV